MSEPADVIQFHFIFTKKICTSNWDHTSRLFTSQPTDMDQFYENKNNKCVYLWSWKSMGERERRLEMSARKNIIHLNQRLTAEFFIFFELTENL